MTLLKLVISSLSTGKTCRVRSYSATGWRVDALVRQLAIIGEASAQLSPDERSRHPQIEWRKIIGLRNIVIHHYFGIDDDIIWDVVQNHVPILRQEVVQILKALPDDETDGS